MTDVLTSQYPGSLEHGEDYAYRCELLRKLAEKIATDGPDAITRAIEQLPLQSEQYERPGHVSEKTLPPLASTADQTIVPLWYSRIESLYSRRQIPGHAARLTAFNELLADLPEEQQFAVEVRLRRRFAEEPGIQSLFWEEFTGTSDGELPDDPFVPDPIPTSEAPASTAFRQGLQYPVPGFGMIELHVIPEAPVVEEAFTLNQHDPAHLIAIYEFMADWVIGDHPFGFPAEIERGIRRHNPKLFDESEKMLEPFRILWRTFAADKAGSQEATIQSVKSALDGLREHPAAYKAYLHSPYRHEFMKYIGHPIAENEEDS